MVNLAKPVDVDVELVKGGIGWSVLRFTIANNIDYPVEIILKYIDGPTETIYYASDTLVLSFKRGEENGIALHMGGNRFLIVRSEIYTTKPGEHLFDIYWRKSDETRKHYLKTVRLIVKGASPIDKIDPFDETLYQKLDDGLPRYVAALTNVVKQNDSYLVHVTLYDRLEKRGFNAVYDVKELVRSTGGDEVELSPIAWDVVSQMKEFISRATGEPKYITTSHVITVKFNAYTEFFKNLFSDRDNAINYFRKRIQEEVVNALKKYNIPFSGVATNIVDVKYDFWGIVTGTNPDVEMTVKVTITYDPISATIVAIIVFGAVTAIIGVTYIHEHFETIRVHDREYYETVREYYRLLETLAETRAKMLDDLARVETDPNVPPEEKKKYRELVDKQLNQLDETEEQASKTIDEVTKAYQEWLNLMSKSMGGLGNLLNIMLVFVVLMLILSLVGSVRELVKNSD